MSITVKDFAAGRKAFFVAPDTSLFPESNLTEYFLQGYECYFIENDKQNTLADKINIIASTFKDCVLIINIDAVIPDINWIEYISRLNATYGKNITICVTFLKKQEKNYRNAIELTFKNMIGIAGDCIQLEYQKRVNVGIMLEYLESINLRGRRMNIRGFCTKYYTYSFLLEEKTYTGVLQDLSLSHFSLVSTEESLQLRVGDVIQDFNFFLNGLIIRASATLMMTRKFNDFVLYVFAFSDKDGTPGLSNRYKDQLVENLLKLNNNYLKMALEKLTLQIKNNVTNPEVLESLVIGQ